MGLIYSRARSTISWVGHASRYTTEAFDLIRQVAEEARATGYSHGLYPNVLNKPGAWLGLHNLACRSYWARLWVIQEIALSPGGLSILCGPFLLDWRRLEAFLLLYVRGNSECTLKALRVDCGKAGIWLPTNNAELQSSLDMMANAFAAAQNFLLGDARTSKMLLKFMSVLKVTDPRDRIYGILNSLGSEFACSIVPQYELSIRDVYKDFALQQILHTKSLDIIAFGAIRPENEGSTHFPCRLPDWREETSLGNGQAHYLCAMGDYEASARMPPDFTTCGDILACNGILVDSIQNVGLLLAVARNLLPIQLTNGLKLVYGSEGSAELSEALLRTLCCDVPVGGIRGAEQSLAKFRNMCHKAQATLVDTDSNFNELAQGLIEISNNLIGSRSISEYLQSVPYDKLADCSGTEATEMYRFVLSTWYGRRLIVTSNGYLALAIDGVVSGNVICVLLGGSVPMVLRPRKGGYEVVGECYVHGLMDGEAIKWLEAGECQNETFNIH